MSTAIVEVLPPGVIYDSTLKKWFLYGQNIDSYTDKWLYIFTYRDEHGDFIMLKLPANSTQSPQLNTKSMFLVGSDGAVTTSQKLITTLAYDKTTMTFYRPSSTRLHIIPLETFVYSKLIAQ